MMKLPISSIRLIITLKSKTIIKKAVKLDIPYYLKDKLAGVGINSLSELSVQNYLHVFQWLKDTNSSLGYKVLFDLYCLRHDLPLNSLNEAKKLELKSDYKKMVPHYAPLPDSLINKYLEQALNIAVTSIAEIPVGAVIVKNNEIIAFGSNQTLLANDITLHAEIVAIKAAAKVLNNHRLDGCDLYVTLEPCLMCIGAILHSRIRRVIFGAREAKTGAIVSQYRVLDNREVNQHTEAIGPVNNAYYARQLQQFMQSRR